MATRLEHEESASPRSRQGGGRCEVGCAASRPPPARPVRLLGTPREVVEETTNVGPVMDQAVARTRGRMQPAGIDADYDLAYEHFDLTHFLLQARHVLSSETIDPIRQFLGNGAQARASPEINFSMAAYVARYPEKADGTERSPYLEWLKRGKAEVASPTRKGPGEDGSVLGMPPAELAELLGATRLDVQERLRTGTLGDMFARAAEVEPLIGEVWSATTELTSLRWRPRRPSTRSPSSRPARKPLAMHGRGSSWSSPNPVGEGAAGPRATRARPATRIEPQDIVVIYTDKGGTAPAGRFPAGVREIDFAGAADGMEREAALRALVELVRSLRGDAVLNINSRVLYEAMATYGKALAASERLFLLLFCNEQLAMGNWVGVPLRFFYRTFDLVDGVLTDSAYLSDWLVDRHQLGSADADRLHVLRAPVDPAVTVVPAPAPDPERRPQVFWAGRWDRQKRVDIAVEVARRMPDVEFRMWGEAVLTPGHMGQVPDNVRLEGRYNHIDELRLSEADVWLYTSAWDGVPSQLLEVAMTGVPIVGSLVGGTGEVLGDDDSWPVREAEDPDAYVRAIRDVLADPADARRRSTALRERLLRERTAAAYAEHVAGLLLDDARHEERSR